MKLYPIRTSIFSPGNDLAGFVIRSLKKRKLQNGDVLAITSKIVSLAENQIVKKSAAPDKGKLIKREADIYIGAGAHNCHLTLKHGLLIPSAGIDESNSSGDFYILYPRDPFASAKKLWQQLRHHYGLKQLGVVLTDSRSTPLRRGVTGVSLAHFGFAGVESLVGQPDLFGREMKAAHINHADAIAGMAVYAMGETNESRPLALLRDLKLQFSDKTKRNEVCIKPEDDLYLPLLRSFR